MDGKMAKTLNEMNYQILTQTFQRHYATKAGNTLKTDKSKCNKLMEMDLLQYFLDPAKMMQEMKALMEQKKLKWSEATYDKYVQFLSNIAKVMTVQERADCMRRNLERLGSDISNFLLAEKTEEDLAKMFHQTVFKPYNDHVRNVAKDVLKNRFRNAKRTPKQEAGYMSYKDFLDLVLDNFNKQDISKAKGKYQLQFLVAALVMLLGGEIARLDIFATKIMNEVDAKDDIDTASLVWNESQKLIKIPKGNKDFKKRFIDLTDERLFAPVERLLEIRRAQGSNHLFLKENGDEPDSNWFGQAFGRHMQKLTGKKMTMNHVRQMVSSHLNEIDDGSLEHKLYVEKQMGHCWENELKFYNREASNSSMSD